jgi:pyrroline-5-carboxylate reductase
MASHRQKRFKRRREVDLSARVAALILQCRSSPADNQGGHHASVANDRGKTATSEVLLPIHRRRARDASNVGPPHVPWGDITGGSVQLAILGAGNIGRAIAVGLKETSRWSPDRILLTRRHVEMIDDLASLGFATQSDNRDAVRRSDVLLLAVQPGQLDALLEEISGDLDPKQHLVISVVSGASLADIARRVGAAVPIVRAMPNIAVALGESMTCLAGSPEHDEALQRAVSIFDELGSTLVIDEEQMIPATALCACGIAFFLRAVRAASQGGIEIGFHPGEALKMAAQTALGAASLVLHRGKHPESEIDSVTTPRGCTISGLNELEHRGFGSAMIKGILTSAEKARSLYSANARD